jgi:outer membrane protein OmpA-like peptidoglycan-associated protein
MKLRLSFFIIIVLLGMQKTAMANPTEFGSSGLLHIGTADTLDSANLCIGVWGNCSKRDVYGINTIMPVTLTLGIGTFWEVYGTYPDVYLNNEAPFSGRGTADVGTKLRFWGQRSSNFKVAADYHLSRYIDDNRKFNGINDMGGRIIASLRSDTIAAHLYGGYMSNGKSRDVVNGIKSDKEYPYGAGVEFAPTTRSKLTVEYTAADAARFESPVEVSLGYQYYITPHLTWNMSYGVGVNAAAPSWRVVFGLSTCQGVGAYIKPIPEVTKGKGKATTGKEVMRPTKVMPLSPLLIKTPALTTPTSKFEVPLEQDGEEIVIRPYGTVVIAQQPAATPVTLPKIPPAEQVQTAAAEPALAPVTPEPLSLPNPVLAEPVPSEPAIVVEKPSASEYSLTRVSGVTPLYGVRLKDTSGKAAVATPVPAIPVPVTAYRKFRLPDNLFEFDNAEMMPEVQKSISELAEFIRSDTKWVFLRIDGHTDGVGSVKYNLDLSLKRAIAVANYLITREGIDPSRIFVRGMGKSAPIADNSSDEGRKLNRRFEIVFLVHKEKSK